MLLRHMTAADDVVPFLVAAMDWRDEGGWDVDRVLATPDVAHYAADWMRPGDAGVIGFEDERCVGAAWWRTFDSNDSGYGHVADDVPEIGLAVLADARGKGYASALLDALLARARAEDVVGLSLSVEDGNDVARGMYVRRGFVAVGREGSSDTLLLRLGAREAA